MDIATHDEVPKEEIKEYSNWLGIDSGIFENHLKDIEDFVDCYLLFQGGAGKCHQCYAYNTCKKLNGEGE